MEHDVRGTGTRSKRRRTRREIFLEKMDRLVPWKRLEKRVEAFYPKAGRGRRPYPLRTMLRVHCVQLFYNLSDPGMEDLLYEVESVRRLAKRILKFQTSVFVALPPLPSIGRRVPRTPAPESAPERRAN